MMSEITENNKLPTTPMADIETCVSRLLRTTKNLLEILTAWSAGQVTDTQVYDQYNTLEIHFTNAIQAFESVSLSMKDMIYLPDALYICLKDTLSKDPSCLDQFLPAIRDIILKLLQGLKEKQILLRERLEDTKEVDMDDPSTKDALNALTMQENLANSSSVRKTKKDTIPLYLKKGSHIKKVNVVDHISMVALQELFRDKLNCNTQLIYILDPESNIEYELEQVSDIKPYSVLSVRDDDTVLNEEMQCLFKQTLNQVLHTVQANHPTKKVKLQQEINDLRHDLDDIQNIYQQLKNETFKVITELRTKTPVAHTVVMLDPSTRAEMNTSRQVTQKAATIITNRLEELQDTIDQIKLDVTQKRCRPSKFQLNHCKEESEIVQSEINDLVNKIKVAKPTWKKTWEVELQQIVKEQQFLKEQEALLVDLKEDHQSLLQVLDQLWKISEIQERKKQAGIALYKVAPVEEGFEGMTSVIKQVSTIQVDHSKRVQALAEAEKMRSKELSQRIDAFEKELTDFVGLKKLKKIGGAEAIERQRQEKDKDLIKQIFAGSNVPQQSCIADLTDETQTLPPSSSSQNNNISCTPNLYQRLQ
ncbi:actin interacting protein 3-domain-containing protein [Thamnidium elegans]|nr:actin interacting protein 3-domain-containing protein [Thamnidium elegans]